MALRSLGRLVPLLLLIAGCAFEVDNPALDLAPGSVLVIPVQSTSMGGERVLDRCQVSLATGHQVLDRAGSDGTYALTGVPAGPIVVFLHDTATGLEAWIEDFTLASAGDAVYLGRIVLEPPQAQVAGTVAVQSVAPGGDGGVVAVARDRVHKRVRKRTT